jgi:WD40 repeat protein/serine/threonine protein kinase
MSSQLEAGSSAAAEQSLALLIERLTARLHAGEALELAEVQRLHPEHAEQLGEVWPTLQALAELERSRPSDTTFLGELGDFRIVREVGRGGMGIVYEAEQMSLRRRVALKVLPFAGMLDPRALRRLHNEARAAASLHHEHIVPVHGVGCERGVHYYAMQFIDGHTLADLIAAQRGPAADTVDASRALSTPDAPQPATGEQPTTAYAPPAAPAPPAARTAAGEAEGTERAPRDAACFRRAAEWAAQAAEALEHAHQLGVVHRDVKPANLMLDGRGKLWVADFGLARFGADAGLTMTGDLLGTLRYMSPEQALAKHGLVDHRTDVYSLGATLYELLTLRPAVEGKDQAEILRRILFDDPTAPRALDRAVPADLETVVLKAMAKEPAERYSTAQELADDLRRFLEHKPVLARRPGAGQRLRKWGRRHPEAVGAGVVVLLLVVVGLAVSTGLITTAYRAETKAKDDAWEAEGKAQANARRADDQRKIAQQQEADKNRQLERARRLLFTAQILRVAAVCDMDPARGLELLEDVEACPPDMREFSWGYYHRLCRRDRRTLTSHTGLVAALAVSADGRTLVSGSLDSTVRLWDPVTGEERAVLRGHTHPVCSVAVSGDGGTVASLSHMVAPGWADVRVSASGASGAVAALSHRWLMGWGGWAPDEVKVWDVKSGKERAIAGSKKGQAFGAVALSRDGRLLVWSDGLYDPRNNRPTGWSSVRVKVWDLALGRERLALAGHTTRPTFLAFTPDGRTLISGGPFEVKVWDLDTGKEKLPLNIKGYCAMALSPDGHTLAADGPGSVTLWDLGTGKAVLSIPRGENQLSCLAFAPDGRTLAGGRTLDYGGGTNISFWDVRTGLLKTHLPAAATALAFTPDGKRLVSGEEEVLRFWDVAPAPEGRRLFARSWTSFSNRLPEWPEVAVVSSDGRLLAETISSRSPPGPGPFKSGVELWELTTGKHLRTLAPLTHNMRALAFTADGSTLAGSFGNQVRVWDTASGRERVLVTGGETLHLAFSPDGRRLAGASWVSDAKLHTEYMAVKLWDTSTGKELATGDCRLRGALTCLAFAPDGRTVAAAGMKEGTAEVALWDWENGRELRTLKCRGGQEVRCLAFTPDSRSLAVGLATSVVLWDLTTGREQVLLAEPNLGVECLAFSRDGQTLASAARGGGGRVKLVDVPTGQARAVIAGLGGRTKSLTFTRDGQSLLALYYTPGAAPDERERGAVGTWRLDRKDEVPVPHGHVGPVWLAAFAPGGGVLATSGADRAVRLWEVNSGKELHRLSTGRLPVPIMAFSPDGKTLAGFTDFQIKLWDVITGKERSCGLPSFAAGLAFSPDGRTLGVWQPRGGDVWLLDVRSATIRATLRAAWAWDSLLTRITFSPDGKTLATGGSGRGLKVWDATSGKLLHEFPQAFGACAYSRDGKSLASPVVFGKNNRHAIRVWDVVSGKERATLPEQAWVDGFSPDGKQLVVRGRDGSASLWEPGSDKVRPLMFKVETPPRASSSLTFSSDRKLLAMVAQEQTSIDPAGWPDPLRAIDAQDWMLRVYEVGSGRLVVSCRQLQPVVNLCFSSDARLLAWHAYQGHEVRLWDLTAGKQPFTLRGHEREILAMTFLPDGRTLATYGADRRLRLWDVKTGRERVSLPGPARAGVLVGWGEAAGVPEALPKPAQRPTN